MSFTTQIKARSDRQEGAAGGKVRTVSTERHFSSVVCLNEPLSLIINKSSEDFKILQFFFKFIKGSFSGVPSSLSIDPKLRQFFDGLSILCASVLCFSWRPLVRSMFAFRFHVLLLC